MSGAVFARIAERVYAKNLRLNYTQARDSNSVLVPDVKAGYLKEASYILDELDIDHTTHASKKTDSWGTARMEGGTLALEEHLVKENLIPNVRGMGARDAVFLLEQKGMYVRVQGVGKVKKQSIAPGNVIHKGQTILLTLGN